MIFCFYSSLSLVQSRPGLLFIPVSSRSHVYVFFIQNLYIVRCYNVGWIFLICTFFLFLFCLFDFLRQYNISMSDVYVMNNEEFQNLIINQQPGESKGPLYDKVCDCTSNSYAVHDYTL